MYLESPKSWCHNPTCTANHAQDVLVSFAANLGGKQQDRHHGGSTAIASPVAFFRCMFLLLQVLMAIEHIDILDVTLQLAPSCTFLMFLLCCCRSWWHPTQQASWKTATCTAQLAPDVFVCAAAGLEDNQQDTHPGTLRCAPPITLLTRFFCCCRS